jgi:hypothetical protein
MQDLRIGLRLLWKDKGFTFTAALTLVACIGANTALFTIVDHVLLRPLQIPNSNRILLIYNSYPKAGVEHAPPLLRQRLVAKPFQRQADVDLVFELVDRDRLAQVGVVRDAQLDPPPARVVDGLVSRHHPEPGGQGSMK